MTRRTWFLIGFLLQLVLVFGLYIPYSLLVSTGTTITLETVPVDPRSIFRGDYVTLAYEVAQDIPWTEVADEEGNPPQSLYLILEKTGDVYTRKNVSMTMPTLAEGEVCLQAAMQWWFGEDAINMTIPDIAQYFVEEGTGRNFEDIRTTHKMLVEASVNSSCNAVITSLMIGPEVPIEEVDSNRALQLREPTGL